MFLRFAAAFCFFCFVSATIFFNVGTFLSSVSEEPVRVDVIVVLGTPERIAKAVQLYKEKFSSRIFLTISEYVNYWGEQGNRPETITVPKWQPQTTYQEALAFKEYLQNQQIDSAIIISDPYHNYRVKWTFQHVFRKSKVKFTYVSTRPKDTLGFWWNDMNSRLFVLTEIPKVLYYWIYHGVLGFETDPEWAIDLKNWYSRKLQKIVASRWMQVIGRGAT
jgi:uncharacterized SAM-binding protein YcdF (DUF218 family)